MLGPFSLPLFVIAFSVLCYRKLRSTSRPLALLVLAAVGLLSAVAINIEPASAQFFGNAETFFNDSFEVGGDAIPLVFAALRALYILYLAVSFIGVINAVRQDEDWQTVARTPALIVVVITLADVLTGLITG